MQSKKICSIVFNSVSRDARVLKEAQSLANAGYDVTILGIQDDKFNSSYELLDNKVMIRRINLQLMRSAAESFIKTSLLLLVAISLFFTEAIYPSLIPTTLVLPVILIVMSGYYLFQFFNRMNRSLLQSDVSASVDQNPYNVLRPFKRILSPLLRLIWNSFKWIPFIRILWKIKPDVVHCHDVHTLPVGVIAKIILGSKLVYDAHEIYEEVPQVLIENGARLRAFKRIHRFSQRYIDQFITINPSIAAWYAERYSKLPKATIIMNATRLSPEVQYDGRLHKAASVGPDTRILLYQGGFSAHRGLDFLIQSAKHLPKNWVLVMMGWGNYESHLRGLADPINEMMRQNGRDDVIRFVPPAPQSELVMWTAGGEIGIIPYENTGLNHWFCTPNKIWELPNAGLAVIVSPFPELRKSVDEFANGWLLPEMEDEHYIGRLLGSLSEDQIVEARKNSRKFIESSNWLTYDRRLVDLYSTI